MTDATYAGRVEVRRRFDAAPERVFDAWLDPAKARRFLFATETGRMVRVEIDPRVGGRFNITEDRPEMGGEVAHVGEYLEIDRPRRLVFTFAVPKFDPHYSTVTLEITPDGEACELVLTQDGVHRDWVDKVPEGWRMILGGLGQEV